MPQITLLRRINPTTGEYERPWKDADGNYVLAKPGAGSNRHHKAMAIVTPDYGDAVGMVRDGYSIRMKGKGTPPSLISPGSLLFETVETNLPATILLREPPVERADLHKDLAQALISQAAAIVCWCGPDAGEAFLGFPPEDESLPYEHVEWQTVDLSRFKATPLFDIAFDFAFQVGRPDYYDPAVWTELAELIDSATRGYVPLISPMANPSSVIRRTGDTAHARWLLDAEPWHDLSVRQLALLADMDETAARNALSKAGISAKGGISNEKAREWLAGRRGFVATEC